MTAPLFEIKARFSEYITRAENGETVEITKHGKTSAVIIGIDEYTNLKNSYLPSFIENIKKWKHKTGGLSEEEFSDFANRLTRDKSEYQPKENIF